MPASGNNSLSILLRVASELFYRCDRIKNYISQIGPKEPGEYAQLNNTILTALVGVESNVIKLLQLIGELPEKERKIPNNKIIEQLDSELYTLSNWFSNIHELLVFLPRLPVMRETFHTLKVPFGIEYEKQKPSVILGSIFNALEFDFVQLMKSRIPDLGKIMPHKSRNIVLQLALCDRESPAAWSILAHELGHAVDDDKKFSENVVRQFVTDRSSKFYDTASSWCKEICADLIAVEAIGPSSIFALLDLEYCVFPIAGIYVPSPSHPPTLLRFEIIAKYLSHNYGTSDFIENEKDFYKEAWDYKIKSDGKEKEIPQIQNRYNHWEKNLFNPMVKVLIPLIKGLGFTEYKLNDQSIIRCLNRLKNDYPIAAQGENRHILRTKIEKYKRKKFADDSDRVREFQALLTDFKETAMDVQSILLSAQIRKRGLITAFIESGDIFTGNSAIDSFCNSLARLDELIINSIRTSSVHREF